MPKLLAASNARAKPICSTSNTGRWNRPGSAKARRRGLRGGVVAITGGASGIGRATAKAFKAGRRRSRDPRFAGRRADRCAAAQLKCAGIPCDVTNADMGQRRLQRKWPEAFGGIDIVVSNAGYAWRWAKSATSTSKILRDSFELNLSTAINAWLRPPWRSWKTQQGFGGCLLFNVSKQALNPRDRTSAPMDYRKQRRSPLCANTRSITAPTATSAPTAVNADRIRSGLLTDAMIADRSKARGVSEKDYMSGGIC